MHNEAVCHVQVDLLLNTRQQEPLFYVLSSSKNGDFSKTMVLMKMFGELHNHCTIYVINSGAPARAKRARSGAPWVRKFGKLSIPENLVMT